MNRNMQIMSPDWAIGHNTFTDVLIDVNCDLADDDHVLRSMEDLGGRAERPLRRGITMHS